MYRSERDTHPAKCPALVHQLCSTEDGPFPPMHRPRGYDFRAVRSTFVFQLQPWLSNGSWAGVVFEKRASTHWSRQDWRVFIGKPTLQRPHVQTKGDRRGGNTHTSSSECSSSTSGHLLPTMLHE
ncbi:unnamed protein product [Ectocarpus sp. 12 AP-2014]